MEKNKYAESFRKQVAILLAEDINERKKITFDVNVMDSLKEDEYEIGENILEEYWREYKGILHNVLVKLVPADLDSSYEFSNVDQPYEFRIVVKGDHTVTVSYYIHSLIYKAYNESADVIEAEGAIINSIEEHLGGSSEDPEMEDEDLAALLNDPELNNVEESTKLTEEDSPTSQYPYAASRVIFGNIKQNVYYLDEKGNIKHTSNVESLPEDAYMDVDTLNTAILKQLIYIANKKLQHRDSPELEIFLNGKVEYGLYIENKRFNPEEVSSVKDYLPTITDY